MKRVVDVVVAVVVEVFVADHKFWSLAVFVYL